MKYNLQHLKRIHTKLLKKLLDEITNMEEFFRNTDVFISQFKSHKTKLKYKSLVSKITHKNTRLRNILKEFYGFHEYGQTNRNGAEYSDSLPKNLPLILTDIKDAIKKSINKIKHTTTKEQYSNLRLPIHNKYISKFVKTTLKRIKKNTKLSQKEKQQKLKKLKRVELKTHGLNTKNIKKLLSIFNVKNISKPQKLTALFDVLFEDINSVVEDITKDLLGENVVYDLQEYLDNFLGEGITPQLYHQHLVELLHTHKEKIYEKLDDDYDVVFLQNLEKARKGEYGLIKNEYTFIKYAIRGGQSDLMKRNAQKYFLENYIYNKRWSTNKFSKLFKSVAYDLGEVDPLLLELWEQHERYSTGYTMSQKLMKKKLKNIEKIVEEIIEE